jgi:hypothetical protein
VLQREAVGYDPSRMLAPRAVRVGAAVAAQPQQRQPEHPAELRDAAAGLAAGRQAALVPAPQRMDIDEQRQQHLQTVRAGAQQQQQQGSIGGGHASDSDESYASAELVTRMRATAASAADLFAAAEVLLQQPAPPRPAETPRGDPADDGSWPAGLAATPQQRLDQLFGAAAQTGGAIAAADDAGGGSAAEFRRQLAATPSPTSSKENEGACLPLLY